MEEIKRKKLLIELSVFVLMIIYMVLINVLLGIYIKKMLINMFFLFLFIPSIFINILPFISKKKICFEANVFKFIFNILFILFIGVLSLLFLGSYSFLFDYPYKICILSGFFMLFLSCVLFIYEIAFFVKVNNKLNREGK